MILSLLGAVPALACSLAQNPTLLVDPTLDDTVAPLAPELLSVDVNRGRGPRGGPFVETTTSCDDIGWIDIALARPEGDTDDDTTVGYRFSLVDGTLPDGLELPGEDEPWLGPVLTMTWIDDATDDQEPFAFTVALTAVDAAGNAGEPIEVDVAHDGGSATGCSTVPHAGGALWLVSLVPLLWRRRASR